MESLASIHQAPCLPSRGFSLPPQPCFYILTVTTLSLTPHPKKIKGSNYHPLWVRESGWCLWRWWSVSKGRVGGRRQSTGGLFRHSFISGGPSLEALFASMDAQGLVPAPKHLHKMQSLHKAGCDGEVRCCPMFTFII